MVILFNKNNNLKISFFRIPLLFAPLQAAACQTRRLIRPVIEEISLTNAILLILRRWHEKNVLFAAIRLKKWRWIKTTF